MEDHNEQTNQEATSEIFDLEEQRRINTEQEEGNEDGIRNGIYNIPKNGNESTKNDSENAQEQIVVPEVDNTIKNEPIPDVQLENSKNFIQKKFVTYLDDKNFTSSLMNYFDENQMNKKNLTPIIPLNNSRNYKSKKEINEQIMQTKENQIQKSTTENQNKSVPIEKISNNQVSNEPVLNNQVSNNLVSSELVSNNQVSNELVFDNQISIETASNYQISNNEVSNNSVSISSALNTTQYYIQATLVDKIYYDKNKIIAIYKELYGYNLYAYEYTIGENSNSNNNWFFPNRFETLTYVIDYYRQKYALSQFRFDPNFGGIYT